MNKVVVCRRWDNVEVKAFVDSEGVGAATDLDDYLKVLVNTIGNPTMIMTKAQLFAKIKLASDTILNEMKTTTVHLV